jgi:hypothetical protein
VKPGVDRDNWSPLDEDAEEALAAAAEGMAQAESNAKEWAGGAERSIRALSSGTRITADGLVRNVGLPSKGVYKNNAVGALFSSLAKRGLIKWTGEYVKSKRVIGHGNLQRVWERT